MEKPNNKLQMNFNNFTKSELIQEITKLKKQLLKKERQKGFQDKGKKIQEVNRDKAKENKSEIELKKISYDLTERVKELSCLYETSNILNDSKLQTGEAYQKILNVIILSYQYPEITAAKLLLDGIEYKTKNYKKTKWNQVYPIIINKKKVGELEVVYLKKQQSVNKNIFLREEWKLLNSITQLITQYVKRQKIEAALRQSEMRFRTLIDKAPVAISLSRNGYYIYNNKMFLKMFGLKSVEECIDKTILNHFASQCREEIAERARLRELKLPVPNEYESIGLNNNGTEFPIYIVVTRVNLADGPASIAFYTNVAERKKAEQALNESREQLKNFASHLQSIREEERIYISRELHDNLGQSLTALRIDLYRIIKKLTDENKENSFDILIKQAQDMISLVDSIIQSVRTIARELRPSALDDLGLLAAIEWQIGEFVKRSGIKCRLTTSLKKIEIEKAYSIGVFRIIQESLTNVLRHSKATDVIIKIAEKEDETVVEIKDNGCGIKLSEINNPKSLGLLGMRERAYLFGGNFSIKGDVGKGTKITLTIPKTKK